MDIFAYYNPKAINERDVEADAIVAPYVECCVGKGTFLPDNERDIQWKVKPECAEACKTALEEAGFRVVIREETKWLNEISKDRQ